ncbi:transcriptional regulator with XRE-family HTH domain [Dyadobacter sp. BE34]|uniref:Transcriptional regulator with XRE-family HTH domain n=2 Tax=Dyadobacter TaxID=120831 RepID=A0ABU1QW57_9BACT|nr:MULTISPECIES: helix-turn-helix transcriptional regulator [Dyadobacter]MDR7042842.1 transcriptional regulator with XRE-family HTH domain [Dyadobacter sp. BE242]MDR7197154.1 transcriptional regulator with XRE-family HTH domain [Dyadobacter sp. BE34]MDR6805398.1 transcriptional regulator with XRE-family HTH domain [Dyadobacter fermentans]MDR7215411.1 transcriptional regulator with XRE-family HTH domain [Dyadobacter sp. BE31]MDR7262947.1 transcriptional regulator with XRE-family HTH domain [Dya
MQSSLIMRLNRIKIVLHEQGKTSKDLAQELGKAQSTVSRWCTNDSQPSLETLYEISVWLKVDIRELLNSTKE